MGRWVQLLTPDGAKSIRGARITHQANGGVTGTVQVHSPINLYHADEGVYQLVAEGPQDAYESPPLVAYQRERGFGRQGRTRELQLMDRATWRLSKSGRSFDTFLATTSTAITAALAADAGVTITGMPTHLVSEEDVKQAKLNDAFTRLKNAYALESYVTSAGNVVCASITQSVGAISFAPDEVKEKISADKRFTGLRVEKSTRISGAQCFRIDPEQTEDTSYHEVTFSNPMTNVLYQATPENAEVSVVVLWSGETVVGAWGADLGAIPVDPTLPVTRATFVLEPTADAVSLGLVVTCRICFYGSPLGVQSGTDASFGINFGNQTRPFPRVYNEALISTAALAQACWPGYHRQINRDYHRLEVAGPWRGDAEVMADLTLACQQEPGGEPWPVSRIDSLTHDFAKSGWRTSLSGIVFPATDS